MWGQENNKLWVFDNGDGTYSAVGLGNSVGIFEVKTWADSITESYLSNNTHFSTYFADEVTEYFSEVLDSGYVMPDGSDNYYTVFGPEGQEKKEADWLVYVRFFDTLFQSTLSIPNTGNTLKWQLEDSIYTQNDIPNHKISNSGKGLITSTDAFTGINGNVYLGATTFTGEFTNFNWGFNRLFANQNSYFGTFPNINNPTCQRINISSNFFSGIEGASNFVNNNFNQFFGTDNEFTEQALENLFEDFHNYWVIQANTPIQNVTVNVSGGISASPNATTQTYISELESEFTGAGFTITITTN
jgi:hypothetical protein